MGSETRKFARVPLPLDAQCRRYNDIAQSWRPIGILDLSAVGMGFTIDEMVEIGEKVQLKIQLPTTTSSLEVFAQIRWQQSSGTATQVGIEFLDLTEEQQTALDGLVRFLDKQRPPQPD